MPLLLAERGSEVLIKKISGNDETRKFLNKLGFIVGNGVTIVSENGGNMTINVKGARIALDKSMAGRIRV